MKLAAAGLDFEMPKIIFRRSLTRHRVQPAGKQGSIASGGRTTEDRGGVVVGNGGGPGGGPGG